MKRIKTFELFTYQDPKIEQISLEDLEEIIFEENEKPYLVAIEDEFVGKPKRINNVHYMNSDEFTSLVFEESKVKLPIVIVVDPLKFTTLPKQILDNCELLLIDELSEAAKLKMILYSLSE